MQSTPRSLRVQIGFFGRRNAGKSSLLNAVAGQALSIVSATPGTTTDPVEKAMEIQPLGPVVLIDTAGLDDEGELGRQRVERSHRVLEKTDLAVLVATPDAWGPPEETFLALATADRRPVVVALNQADRVEAPEALRTELQARGVPVVQVSAATGQGLGALRALLVETAPPSAFTPTSLVGDLVPPGETCLLVVPIDKEAPTGRLILPQAQVLRDLLDHGALGLCCRDTELPTALARLTRPPALVVTDSQAFAAVDAAVPPEVPLTSFSILFARARGDLGSFVRGARLLTRPAAEGGLAPGDRVLVAESCTHHPVEDDIGTVKLPAWLERRVGGRLVFDHVRGVDFPADLSPYRLVVHCGACMAPRRLVLSRQARAEAAGVAMTNYGVAIAACLGIEARALRRLLPPQAAASASSQQEGVTDP